VTRCLPLAAVLLLAGIPSTLAHPGKAAGDTTVTRARYLMGTIFRFEAPAGTDPRLTAERLEAALDEVDRLENVLSNWRAGSELSRLNAAAPQRDIPVSEDLFRAVQQPLRWARETGGAFDPTVEPLTRRFRGGFARSDPRPSAGRPPAGPRHGDWRDVHLDAAARTIRFEAGVEGLDLGGIGKGYALDRAGEFLKSRGMPAFLLDAGGQVLAVGAPPGESGWWVAVADPEQRERAAVPLLLRDVSAATSGNSQRPGEIIDPIRGESVNSRGSSTALAPDATTADALSTALFVLGPEEGTRWARQREDMLALYLEPGPIAGDSWLIRGTVPDPRRAGEILAIHSAMKLHRRVLHAAPW